MSLVHSLSHLLLNHYSYLLKTPTPPTPSLFSAPDLSPHFTDTMTSIRREPPWTPPKPLYTTGICSQVLFSQQLPSMNLPRSQLQPFLPFVHRIHPLSTTHGHCSRYCLFISVVISSYPPSLPCSYCSPSLVSLLWLRDIRHTPALESLLCFHFLESSSHR